MLPPFSGILSSSGSRFRTVEWQIGSLRTHDRTLRYFRYITLLTSHNTAANRLQANSMRSSPRILQSRPGLPRFS